MYFFQKNRGFTLVEMMVVITIIALLTGVVLTAVFNARKESRDMSRVTDLQQVKLALKLYKEAYGEYPCEDASLCSSPKQTEDLANVNSGGINPEKVIGGGGHIDELLAPFLGEVPKDPLHDGETYYYYFDPYQVCGSNDPQAVVFARTMESDKYSNIDDTKCTSWGGEGGAGQLGSHVIIVGPSDSGQNLTN